MGDHARLKESISDATDRLCELIEKLPEQERIDALNGVRLSLRDVSPLANHPIDCVLWVPADRVEANDYNPNNVAPPEMKLLQISIEQDGYTQPVVGFGSVESVEVVDGFHRNKIGKEVEAVRESTHGRLPVTLIRDSQEDRADRVASTIRHNRARGKHQVQAMSEIVLDLARRNWSDAKIGRELGMEPDEVLRLKQISGLAEMFADEEFSEAWEAAK